jgi:hypothetical protein
MIAPWHASDLILPLLKGLFPDQTAWMGMQVFPQDHHNTREMT